MKKRIFAIVFLLFFYLEFNAQTDSVYYGTKTKDTAFKPFEKRNTDWLKRFTYGGNAQAYFTSYYTYLYLSPTIGFSPIEKFNFGVGGIYSYVSLNYSGYGRLSQSIYGLHTYARYFFNQSFFAQGQFDHLLQPDVYNFYNPEKKVWVDYTLIGGGFRQPLGKNAALITSIMVNITPSRLSIYPTPVIQIGFMGGF